LNVAIPGAVLYEFCRRWKVAHIAIFGSALRADFNPDSDIDLLVEFEPGHGWSVLDHIRMETELTGILGRRVEVVSREALAEHPNRVIRDEIERTAKPLDVT
jgi:hypothetical protein